MNLSVNRINKNALKNPCTLWQGFHDVQFIAFLSHRNSGYALTVSHVTLSRRATDDYEIFFSGRHNTYLYLIESKIPLIGGLIILTRITFSSSQNFEQWLK
jgi:hypothetical protein